MLRNPPCPEAMGVVIHMAFMFWLLAAHAPTSLSLSTNNSRSSASNLLGATTRNVATQILQGAGPPAVDLNRYNLETDVMEQEWKVEWAQGVSSSAQAVQLRLACHDAVQHYVDALRVTFDRQPDTGLGMELRELAGGRTDGVGLTIVTGLVDNGSAAVAGADIWPGDALSEVTVVRRQAHRPTSNQEVQQVFTTHVECLDFATTAAKLQHDLPDYDAAYQDTYEVTVKRLRRKPKVNIKLQYPPSQTDAVDETITLFAGENLRQGMLVRGVKLNDELARRFDTKTSGNCGAGGLCRTCAVAVVKGNDLLNEQRVAEQHMLRDAPRWRLACKAIVGYGMQEGDVTIRVNPRQW